MSVPVPRHEAGRGWVGASAASVERPSREVLPFTEMYDSPLGTLLLPNVIHHL